MSGIRTPWRTLATALSIAALAACSDEPTAGPTGPDRATAVAADSDTDVVAPPADGDLYPGEKEALALAQQIPGYAGDWYDRGTRVVALTDPSSEQVALRTLSASGTAERGQHNEAKTGSGTRFVPAQFDYLTLRDFRDRAAEAVLSVDGATYLDLDERTNRVVVGITDESRRGDVEGRFKEMGVPAEATEVVVTGKIEEQQTLQQYKRPLEGGWQIQSSNGSICTLGFITRHPVSGAPSFVTASHCTSTLWGLDGNLFSQNVNPLWVGRESRDPMPFRCYVFFQCRNSDAALVQVNAGVTVAPGRIARTQFFSNGWGIPGSITIDNTLPSLVITATQPYPSAGQWLDKVGRTTGWTMGQVTNTCVTVLKAPGRLALCQYMADYYASGGDSGAPVFIWYGDTVTLAGLHWGANTFTQRTIFSPVRGIQLDLGVP